MRFGRVQRRKTGVTVTRAVLLVLFMTVLFRHAQFLLSPVLDRLMTGRLMTRAPGYTALPHCNEALSQHPLALHIKRSR